ncbi:putative proteinC TRANSCRIPTION FACTOR-LIKE PROTEIN [Salix koriyanagi]|uniref:NAC domain-containing protein n=1 Tax=Salix koriyanagi TaxID=2511006 RepID=A0A9Q0X2B2_9ROSI|nr:putative proteinC TRANSCRIPTION FACTOR-LIKE PROTEIN [Salix koriyanagi]
MQDSDDHPARRCGPAQLEMPSGWIFAPSDEVLVIHYLSKKSKNEPLPCPYAVLECDLYGREPNEIWKEFGGDRLKGKIDLDVGLFFFTRLKKKGGSHGSSRIDRSVGNNDGTWHEDRSLRRIVCTETKKIIGSKRRFTYRSNRSHNRGRVSWHMFEISLPGNSSDHVVCQLKRKERKSMESGRGDAGVENENGQGAPKLQRTNLEEGDAGVENDDDEGVEKRQRTDSWTNQEAGPSFFNSNKTPESYEGKRNSTASGEETGASIGGGGGGHSFDLNIEWTDPDEDDTSDSDAKDSAE